MKFSANVGQIIDLHLPSGWQFTLEWCLASSTDENFIYTSVMSHVATNVTSSLANPGFPEGVNPRGRLSITGRERLIRTRLIRSTT